MRIARQGLVFSEIVKWRPEMSNNWYYVKSGQRFGPISSRQLRELAERHAIAGGDLVWKEGLKDWIPASKVEGLLPERASKSPSLFQGSFEAGKPAALADCSAPKNSVWENPYLIGVLIVLAFPVGAYLAWRHPRWSKQNKAIWACACAAFLAAGVSQRRQLDSRRG